MSVVSDALCVPSSRFLLHYIVDGCTGCTYKVRQRIAFRNVRRCLLLLVYRWSSSAAQQLLVALVQKCQQLTMLRWPADELLQVCVWPAPVGSSRPAAAVLAQTNTHSSPWYHPCGPPACTLTHDRPADLARQAPTDVPLSCLVLGPNWIATGTSNARMACQPLPLDHDSAFFVRNLPYVPHVRFRARGCSRG